MYPRANSANRITATLWNVFLGSLPLSIPNILYLESELGSPLKTEALNDALAVTLAVLQLVFVFIVRGSPGYAVAGLRVQMTGGAALTIKATALRSLPHFVCLGFILALPRARHAPGDAVTDVLLVLC